VTWFGDETTHIYLVFGALVLLILVIVLRSMD